MEQKLIDGKEMTSDGSYIPAEVSRNSWIDIEVEVEQSMLCYLDDLDQELASQPGFKKPPGHTVTKKITTSTTDCKYGIVTGVDVFPANEKESLLILRHLERQQKQLGLSMEKVALDRGYDTGAVHNCNKSIENTFPATRCRGMFAENVLPVRLVLIWPVCAEEFWPAATILRFREGI